MPTKSQPTTQQQENASATAATPKAAASQPFRKPKSESRSALTHEQIADDLAAFHRAGGTIEVLGNTHTLKSIPPRIAPVPIVVRTERDGKTDSPSSS